MISSNRYNIYVSFVHGHTSESTDLPTAGTQLMHDQNYSNKPCLVTDCRALVAQSVACSMIDTLAAAVCSLQSVLVDQ